MCLRNQHKPKSCAKSKGSAPLRLGQTTHLTKPAVRKRFLPSEILSRKVSLLLTNMCVLRAGISPPLAHSWKSLDLASHPTLTRDTKLVWKSAKRGEMLQVYPLHLPWKKKKILDNQGRNSSSSILEILEATLLKSSPGLPRAWANSQLVSRLECVRKSNPGCRRGRRECPARCYMWMCKLQQMMHLAIMFFAYISRNNSSQTANILLNSHTMTMCHTVTQQGAWK